MLTSVRKILLKSLINHCFIKEKDKAIKLKRRINVYLWAVRLDQTVLSEIMPLLMTFGLKFVFVTNITDYFRCFLVCYN